MGIADGISQRLREVRGSDSRARVQELTGIHPNTLAHYEDGERVPGVEFLIRFSAAYRVSLLWLITGSDQGNEPTSGVDGYLQVPVWNVEASSGHGAFVGHEEIGAEVLVPERLIRKYGATSSNLCAVFNRGSSNSPDINDGDIMFVDRNVEQIQDDAYYLFQEDDALLVKMIERAIGGGAILKSRNPSYEARLLNREDAARLNVFGRVRWRIGPI